MEEWVVRCVCHPSDALQYDQETVLLHRALAFYKAAALKNGSDFGVLYTNRIVHQPCLSSLESVTLGQDLEGLSQKSKA
jgi:hypothetical protein